MKFTLGPSCTWAVLLGSTPFGHGWLMVPAAVSSTSASTTTASSRQSSSSLVLQATVEEEASTSLVPPKSMDELLEDNDVTSTLYDSNVQKTYGRYPLIIKNGKGCRLYTTDGNEYLDFVSGIATCALGHSNQELTDAIFDQMQQVHHVSNLYLIPAQAALAEWLCANSSAEKVFFCNSGAEANEAAIKCARKHAHVNLKIAQPVIITAEQSFHGRTLAAITATGQPKYHQNFGYGGDEEGTAMVPGFRYIPYNDVAALEAMVKEIQETPGQGVAAILMEPLQGEGGIVPGQPEFFAKIRSICDETGALMMCDEVQVGMGRSGCLWGHQNLNVEPDVFTSAKALGGGVPIGAMMARGVAADVFGPGDHASTYGGNPLACRAGLAVAQYFSDHSILENVQARGAQLSLGLEVLAKKYGDVLGEVRGWGLLKGIAVKEESGLLAGQVVAEAMKEGLLLVAAGGNVVRFVPPLIVSEQEVEEALTKLDTAVAATVEAALLKN